MEALSSEVSVADVEDVRTITRKGTVRGRVEVLGRAYASSGNRPASPNKPTITRVSAATLTYGLLLLLAFAAPFVLLLFVRASARQRIVMVMSATAFVLMALYGVALLSDLIPA